MSPKQVRKLRNVIASTSAFNSRIPIRPRRYGGPRKSYLEQRLWSIVWMIALMFVFVLLMTVYGYLTRL